jgi:carbonic anhydrase
MATVTDTLVENSRDYTADFDKGSLPLPPGKGVAVLACMDARLNPYGLLGLEEIVLIHHTDCGMLTFTDEEFAQKLEDETGERPEWSAHAFGDVEGDVRAGIATIRESPFIPRTDDVRGFVYDVHSGALTEVA